MNAAGSVQETKEQFRMCHERKESLCWAAYINMLYASVESFWLFTIALLNQLFPFTRESSHWEWIILPDRQEKKNDEPISCSRPNVDCPTNPYYIPGELPAERRIQDPGWRLQEHFCWTLLVTFCGKNPTFYNKKDWRSQGSKAEHRCSLLDAVTAGHGKRINFVEYMR